MNQTAEGEPSYVRTYDLRLVRLIGAHGAMIVSQLEWLLSIEGGRDYDGEHWVWKSHEEWGAEVGLTKPQARRELDRLSEEWYWVDARGIRRGRPKPGVLVRIHNPIKGWDQTFWYRINADHPVLQVTNPSHASDDSITWGDDSVTCKVPKRHVQVTASADASAEFVTAIPESTSEDDDHESTSATHAQEDASVARETVCALAGEDEDRSARKKGRTRPSRKAGRRGVPQSDPATQKSSGKQMDSQKTEPSAKLGELDPDGNPWTPQKRMDELRAKAAERAKASA